MVLKMYKVLAYFSYIPVAYSANASFQDSTKPSNDTHACCLKHVRNIKFIKTCKKH